MLIRLTKDDITKEYNKILGVLDASIPHYYGKDIPGWKWNAFVQMMLDNLQVWKLVWPISSEDPSLECVGYLITRIYQDDIFLQRFMLIYGVQLYKQMPVEFWIKCETQLEELARQAFCTRIEAYEDNERVVDISVNAGYMKKFRSVKSLV